MQRKLLSLICGGALFLPCAAQDNGATLTDWDPSVGVAFDTRFDLDFQHTRYEGNNSGFHGRYFNLMVDGSVNSQISFSWRQRLNKFKEAENDVFAATDWAYITYRPTRNFAFSGGKQVVAIGGYEYDRAPIDIYFASRFWNNIACYQFGVSASVISNSGNQSLLAQVCNSPYRQPGSSCFAYNLMWNGHMDFWSTIWTVNLLEYLPGHFANYISLGNRLDFGPFYTEIDLMNRYAPHQRFWLDDYSIIGKAAYTFDNRVTLFAKGGYERYKPQVGLPYCVEKPFIGGGLEFYPVRGSKNLRIHALWDMTHDNDGIRTSEFNIGLKWRVKIL